MKIIALISTRKGLFSLNSNLKINLVDFLGVPVSYTLASANQKHWYTTLDHGHFGVKLHRSSDQGNTWEEITCPAYPSSGEDSEDKGDSLSLIWSMAYGDTSSDTGDKVWAGTIPGGLFYSEDAGNSWQLNQPLWEKKQELEWFGGGFDQAGIHSICVDPRDTNEIKVAISCAGVWVTKDGGESWKNQSQGMRAAYMPPEKVMDVNIQDPHMMVQCPSAPDCLWVQHHNGIFKSTDNSESWQEIEDVSPSVFGFATTVHPDDPNKVWFVPGVKDECRVAVDGKLVVTHSKDGGESFQQLSNGLPEENCYDLIFRHALDIDAAGSRLLMGSTTGNLWYSDDEGENWKCLSNHLPPVFAVKFL